MEARNQSQRYVSAFEPAKQRQIDELITDLMRGKWIILAAFAVVLSITALYTFLSKPVYEAVAMVMVHGKAAPGTLPILDVSAGEATTRIANELQTLRARSTAMEVAHALLERTYLDSAKTIMIPIIQKIVEGEPQNEKETADAVADRLPMVADFTPVKESDVIRISVRRHDPVEAAIIADTFTKVDAEKSMDASRTKSRAIREFLQSQMGSKQANLDSAERALKDYMKTSGVVTLDATTNTVVNELAQLEATRNAIDVDITTRQKTLDSYKQEVAVQEPNVAKAMGESSDTYIRLLQEQLARLEVQRDVVIAQNPDLNGEKAYTEKVDEINAQIASLKKTLQVRTKAYLGSLVPGDAFQGGQGGSTGFLAEGKQKIIEQQIELEGLKARRQALDGVIADYERQFRQIPDKNIELAKLQRARVSNEKLYLLVEEKFNEAAITESSDFGNVNVLDPAILPKKPISPNVILNLVFGSLSGLFLGVVIVVVRSRLDDRIRGPEDLKKRGIVPLGTIGRFQIENQKNGKNGHAVPAEMARLSPNLVAFTSPFSAMSEGYRHLRTNLLFIQPDKPIRTILVSSSSPQEGKSTTAANLAISFAQGENRVLLVDADMRRPTANTLFGVAREPGLSNVISNPSSQEVAVHRRVLENLDVLSSGTVPPNPAEILGSRRMREFIDRMKSSYDIVIFDSPPLLAATDAAILSSMVDVALIVVRAGETGFALLERAAEILQGVGKNPAGIVVNNFDAGTAYGGYYGRHRRETYAYAYGYGANGDGKSKDHRSKTKN